MKIFISLMIAAILVGTLYFNIDAKAMALQDEIFNRAMISFGLAKGLNAIISLLQGTEFSVTPVGVGLNFSVGEILDPFNDIVERFSWVMLLSSVSLGIQKLFLLFSSKIFLQVALALSALIALAFLWIKKLYYSNFTAYVLKSFLFLLLIRFSAVMFVYTSQFIYDTTLKNEYIEASKVVQQTQKELQDVENNNEISIAPKQSSGFFSSFGSKYNSVIASLDLKAQLKAMQESIDKASRNIITLITIFIFQTIIMPLLFLYFFILAIKLIFKVEISEKRLQLLYNSNKKTSKEI
ncbi:hypothetical protein [Sulfurimonas sp.]